MVPIGKHTEMDAPLLSVYQSLAFPMESRTSFFLRTKTLMSLSTGDISHLALHVTTEAEDSQFFLFLHATLHALNHMHA